MTMLRWRSLLALSALTAAWCALWGDLSVANVVSGLAVGWLALWLTGARPARGGVGIRPLLRFVALVIGDLIRSTWSVAVEVLTPTDRTDEVVVDVAVPEGARSHLMLLIVAVTVTPGTAVVDVDRATGVLTLHILHRDRVDATTEHVRELAELACRAFPVEHEVAA